MNSEDSPTLKLEFRDPCGELDPHPLTKRLPAPNLESAQWKAFIDGLSAAGPDGPDRVPPLVITDEGLVMDGCRRLLAAKRLQWDRIPCVIRPEWEAPLIILESLCGQHSYTKSAKAYLFLPLLREYSEAAHHRQVMWLKNGTKISESAHNSQFPHSVRTGYAAANLAQLVGVSVRQVEYAIQVSKTFESVLHKFDMPEGDLTLREIFEPKILDPENPMGLGRVIQGIGEFVDENGKPRKHPPFPRNSRLHFMTKSWGNAFEHVRKYWSEMPDGERNNYLDVATDNFETCPTEFQEEIVSRFKSRLKNQRRTQQRHTASANLTE